MRGSQAPPPKPRNRLRCGNAKPSLGDQIMRRGHRFAGRSSAGGINADLQQTRSRIQVLDLRATVVPKGLLGRAIRYTLDEWERLIAYADDGHVDIDNNACEREIKQVVMGRKAWLFADTPDGARANAVLYSLVRTAIANDIDPYKYLVTILTRWPRMKKATDVLNLMPWSLKDEWAGEAESLQAA